MDEERKMWKERDYFEDGDEAPRTGYVTFYVKSVIRCWTVNIVIGVQ